MKENGSCTMILETRAVAPFFKNGFVSAAKTTREGVVIDPGDEVDELLEAVGRHQLTIRYILLTHAHIDHITGVGAAKKALGVPVGLHQDDMFLYEAVVQQGQMLGVRAERAAGRWISSTTESGPWRFGTYGAWVFTTRRAIVQAACAWRSAATRRPERTLFVGDTLFAGSIGRVDLPGGDFAMLLNSIRERSLHVPGRQPSSIPVTASRPRSATRRGRTRFLIAGDRDESRSDFDRCSAL